MAAATSVAWTPEGDYWVCVVDGRKVGIVEVVAGDPCVRWSALAMEANGLWNKLGGFMALVDAELKVEKFLQLPVRLAPRSLVIAANVDDVMREQLEFLIEHAEAGDCGCHQCDRYHAIRALLLSGFAEASKPVQAAKAAA